ncbi:SDR family oxidoreductase [Acinetobacter apis]|uniref:NAD(P)-dependent dehydrogenase, short-chain alcohol dehydrogenase family n=1 Tax=Acinetobacter apis TaxID=1229165 RepID=A0A217EE33_9GAMM|nr:SDR family oxidoreductase [Acinetobacter apis]SNQ28751.1 NAD(P)-dependent dehydrogenase, short-chain alcohol dehydrogenase family [Acinetobacter apis]
MSFQISGKVAVVTGGSSGIGLATVKVLLSEGASVAWCGRSQNKLTDSINEIRELFPEGKFFTACCDVLNKAEVEAFASNVYEQFGQVDFLINNAGQGRVSSFHETKDQDWIDEIQLKYFSVLNPVKAFIPYLEKSDVGSITNVNSLLAIQPEEHMIATSAARAALLNLTHSLSREFLHQNVRVNSILLGMVESDQWRRRFKERDDQSVTWEEWTKKIAQKRGIPLQRLGKPEEPAHALVFLASPLASYTTGSVIDVSGGFNRHI